MHLTFQSVTSDGCDGGDKVEEYGEGPSQMKPSVCPA